MFDPTEDLSIYGRIPTVSVPTPASAYTLPTNWDVYGFIIVSSKMITKNGEYFESNWSVYF